MIHFRSLAFIAASSLMLAGCSKDSAVLDFVKENDEVVAAVSAASTPEAAQKAFDDKKADLKAKFEPLKTARSFQVKPENMTKLTDSVTKGTTAVCGLELKAVLDAAKSAKYKKLCDDYTDTMKM
jgi:PBP1b-binding outer membrane lipoprotein LpoB